MARRIIEIEAVTCDACAKVGQESEATEVLTIKGDSYDLCDPHADKFAARFRELFGPGQSEDQDEAEPEDDGDDFEDQDDEPGEESAQTPAGLRGSVVITGEVQGYTAKEARTAVERLGYTIAGHVDEDTVLIVTGHRPAPHKIAEAREYGTPVLNTVEHPKAFGRGIAAGELSPAGSLPKVTNRKKTAADVRAAG
ncbi:hypothetical protein [Streptomyces sp. URMC 125]|uniref:hypothetical protein n=1 Tax=Streptomyces sp. URMC 125 TaxID=3423419 RepID=UPI003F1BB4AF